jgi:hypothetical protein
VVPSLTAVSEDAAAASLRRTRTTLAGGVAERAGVAWWRWSLAAATAVVLAMAWLASGPDRASHPDLVVNAVPTGAPLVGRPLGPNSANSPAPASAGTRIGRVAAARAGTVAAHTHSQPTRRPDPLLALMDAVQAIPDEAWDRGVALVQSPVAVPQVPLQPIAIVPLETPPIVDAPAESIAPGEP